MATDYSTDAVAWAESKLGTLVWVAYTHWLVVAVDRATQRVTLQGDGVVKVHAVALRRCVTEDGGQS